MSIPLTLETELNSSLHGIELHANTNLLQLDTTVIRLIQNLHSGVSLLAGRHGEMKGRDGEDGASKLVQPLVADIGHVINHINDVLHCTSTTPSHPVPACIERCGRTSTRSFQLQRILAPPLILPFTTCNIDIGPCRHVVTITIIIITLSVFIYKSE